MNKKTLTVFVIVALVALAGAWYLTGPETLPGLSEHEFPKELAGMPLTQLVTGEEAIVQISRLHGTDIKIVDGLVAMYGSHQGSRHLVVWVSQSRDKDEATKLLNIMDEKMPNSSAFSQYSKKIIDGRMYYYVYGIGLDNYYYQKGSRLYWVGIKDKDPEATLMEIVPQF